LKKGLLLCLLLVLISGASSLPEKVALGEYEVSFDLGTTGYTIKTEELKENVEGLDYVSHLCWIENDRIILVALTDWQLPIEVDTPLIRKGVIDLLNHQKCTGIENYVVTIDQKPGVWGWGKRSSGVDLLCASYWPDLHQVNGTYIGQVECTIVSDGASAEVAENLLNTIHVEVPGTVPSTLSLPSETGQ